MYSNELYDMEHASGAANNARVLVGDLTEKKKESLRAGAWSNREGGNRLAPATEVPTVTPAGNIKPPVILTPSTLPPETTYAPSSDQETFTPAAFAPTGEPITRVNVASFPFSLKQIGIVLGLVLLARR